MRKFAFILALIISVLFICQENSILAKADSKNYMRIIDDSTPFFADENTEDLLFYLPYTYYVKILSVDGNVAHVEFGNKTIDGYTFIDRLFEENNPVSNPYPELTITTHKTAVLYSDVTLNNEILYVFSERSLNYLGRILSDEGYLYYVEYNKNLGYIKEECIYPFTLPNHDNPLTFLPNDDPPIEETDNPSPFLTPFRIIIFSLLILAGIIAVIWSVKSKKSPSTEGDYYGENDYE